MMHGELNQGQIQELNLKGAKQILEHYFFIERR
jgi:hypothetical protein